MTPQKGRAGMIGAALANGRASVYRPISFQFEVE
jgi:hypothetical protein